MFLAVIAVRRRWAVLSGPAGALGRLGGIGRWVESRRETILSVETGCSISFTIRPRRVLGELRAQLAGHVAAMLEVYLILRLMGCHAGVLVGSRD